MARRSMIGLTRRTAIAAPAVAAVAFGFGVRLAGAQRMATGSGGLAGGGIATGAESEIQFSLFASRLVFEDQADPTLFGKVQWEDLTQQMSLVSVEISAYGPVEGEAENLRELRGTMRVNETDEHPFVLRAVDAGAPGSGEDTIALTVGPAALATPSAAAPEEVIYSVETVVTAGDIQLLDLTTPNQG